MYNEIGLLPFSIPLKWIWIMIISSLQMSLLYFVFLYNFAEESFCCVAKVKRDRFVTRALVTLLTAQSNRFDTSCSPFLPIKAA